MHKLGPYAALSYCWGPPEHANKQLKLSTHNLAIFRSHISSELLSPVQRDAITVCRTLGIRYLWIDSLCIIQNDKADWEEQSEQMANIFAGSSLTICSLASSSCMEGFLTPRAEPVKFKYTSITNSQICGLISLRPVPEPQSSGARSVRAYETPWTQDLKVSFWATRGWVLQERVLSRRKLYFGDSMIHVQDGDTVYSENGFLDSCQTELVLSLGKSGRILTLTPSNNGTRGIRKNEAYEIWHSIVTETTGLKWTNAPDLIPGLSGLASIIQETTGDKYVAGHWVGDLACSLIWNTTSNPYYSKNLRELTQLLQQGNAQNAPSWSWASRQDFHGFYVTVDRNNWATFCRRRTHLRLDVQLIDACAFVDGLNPFGKLNNTPSFLLLSGRMLHFNPDFCSQKWEDPYRFITYVWLYTAAPGMTLCIGCDWGHSHKRENIARSLKGLGIQPNELGHLRLLLLSSCCSTDMDEKELGSVNWLADVNFRSCPEWFCHASRPGYFDTFLNDPDHRDGDGTCSYCEDRARPRDIYGLLLYPVNPGSEENKYYKVGVFWSRFQQGGWELFQGVEEQKVKLV